MPTDANQRGPPAQGKDPDHFLAEWREYRGYSQRRLGDVLGVSNSKISRIKAGETELRPRFAKKVAQLFRIPMMALFTVNPQGEGRRAAEMLDIFADIPASKHEDALRVLRAFANGGTDKKAG